MITNLCWLTNHVKMLSPIFRGPSAHLPICPFAYLNSINKRTKQNKSWILNDGREDNNYSIFVLLHFTPITYSCSLYIHNDNLKLSNECITEMHEGWRLTNWKTSRDLSVWLSVWLSVCLSVSWTTHWAAQLQCNDFFDYVNQVIALNNGLLIDFDRREYYFDDVSLWCYPELHDDRLPSWAPHVCPALLSNTDWWARGPSHLTPSTSLLRRHTHPQLGNLPIIFLMSPTRRLRHTSHITHHSNICLWMIKAMFAFTNAEDCLLSHIWEDY